MRLGSNAIALGPVALLGVYIVNIPLPSNSRFFHCCRDTGSICEEDQVL